jgi:hypothetical protein
MNQQTIDTFIQEYFDFQNSFRQKAQEKLKQVFSEFWEENPAINVIVWTQYAPYFNDGGACVFSVNDLLYSNASEQDDIDQIDAYEYGGENESIWCEFQYGIKKIKGVNVESIKILEKFMHSDAMEDVLEIMFGSNNKIVATRAGFVSEDYDHD